MKTVKNKTRKPLSVPLPAGKKLFLGPSKSGQIASKDADHPALVALVEADKLEIIGEAASYASRDGGAGPSVSSGQDQARGKTIFKSGDS